MNNTNNTYWIPNTNTTCEYAYVPNPYTRNNFGTPVTYFASNVDTTQQAHVASTSLQSVKVSEVDVSEMQHLKLENAQLRKSLEKAQLDAYTKLQDAYLSLNELNNKITELNKKIDQQNQDYHAIYSAFQKYLPTLTTFFPTPQ